MPTHSDVNSGFRRNEKDLVVHDEDAINEAIDNILRTRPGERIFNRGFGSSLYGLLFEPITPSTANRIASAIVHYLSDLESRLSLVRSGVRVVPFPEEARYEVTVTYRLRGGGLGQYTGALQAE